MTRGAAAGAKRARRPPPTIFETKERSDSRFAPYSAAKAIVMIPIREDLLISTNGTVQPQYLVTAIPLSKTTTLRG